MATLQFPRHQSSMRQEHSVSMQELVFRDGPPAYSELPPSPPPPGTSFSIPRPLPSAPSEQMLSSASLLVEPQAPPQVYLEPNQFITSSATVFVNPTREESLEPAITLPPMVATAIAASQQGTSGPRAASSLPRTASTISLLTAPTAPPPRTASAISLLTTPTAPPSQTASLQTVPTATGEASVYPVFFQPASGKLFMSVNGNYHRLPRHFDATGEGEQPRVLQPSAPVLPNGMNSLLPSRSPTDQATAEALATTQWVPRYYKGTFVLITILILCLDFPAVLLCLFPALYCIAKAKRRRNHRHFHNLRHFKAPVVVLNVLAIVLHLLLVAAILAMLLIPHFVLDVY